jgi:hypothetical protein
MTRPWIRCAVLAVLVVASSTACGADKKPSAGPEPTPKATASSTPGPSPTPSTPPEQPRGASGVTYDILNWDEYADDPALLAWKQTTEAASGSMNGKKLLPALRQGTTPSMYKRYLGSVQNGWTSEWHVKPLAKVRVLSAKTRMKKADLQVCVWDPSSVFYEKDNSAVGGDLTQEWSRQKVGMTLQGTQWRVSAIESAGKCKGVPAP